jgi:hypothetical protein
MRPYLIDGTNVNHTLVKDGWYWWLSEVCAGHAVPVDGGKIDGNGPLALFGPGSFVGQDGPVEVRW